MKVKQCDNNQKSQKCDALFQNAEEIVCIQHKTLEERTTDCGGKLNLDGECDWGEKVGSEVW